MVKKTLKPNGLEVGVFIISIDDGYVEYSYHIEPEECNSISEIHKWICRVLGAKREEGKIRVCENCANLQAENKLYKKALKEIDDHCCPKIYSPTCPEIAHQALQEKPNG